MRAAVSNTMSTHGEGGAFWYQNASNYQNRRGYSATIEHIEDLTRRERQHTPSDRGEQADRLHYPDALSHYLATYSSPATPPSWLVIELLTAGELQHLYASLPLKYRKIIARELNLPDQVLQSWLKTYVRVRNICAHHGRLWNRFLGVYPAIPRSPTVRWLNDRSTFDTGNPRALERKRLYPVLVSLQSILFTISPHSTWALRLHTLLEKYHDIPLNALGKKANWDAAISGRSLRGRLLTRSTTFARFASSVDHQSCSRSRRAAPLAWATSPRFFWKTRMAAPRRAASCP